MDRALQAAIDWFASQDRVIVRHQPLSGGSICDAWRLEDEARKRYFVKTHPNPPAKLFAAEVAGLEALRSSALLRVPAVIHRDDSFLILEHLDGGQSDTGTWEILGQGLARMHARAVSNFGFSMDNYCGETPQTNPPVSDGHRFFAEHRLIYQGRRARDRGLLGPLDMRRIESLCRRLPDCVPVMPPVLLHGDLWSGNMMVLQGGEPALIDPAAYWGWAEADIAMTSLFGGFAESFYSNWEAGLGPEPGWRDRLPLYNLYHLLNHLNLFGRGYLGGVQSVLDAFS